MNKGEIERLAKKLRIPRDAMNHDNILASARAALKSAKGASSGASAGRTASRIILTGKRARLAAAAVAIVAFSIGAGYWLVHRCGDGRIPAELTQMDRAELFDLYVKGSESFNKEIVAAAMKKSFEGISRKDLSVLGEPESGDQAFDMRERAGILMFRAGTDPRVAVSRVVEACDLMAQVRIEQVTPHAEDLTAALLDKYIHEYIEKGISDAEANGLSMDSAFRDDLWRECVDALAVDFPDIDFYAGDLGQRVRTEVQLHVIKAYPSTGVADRLLIRPVFDVDQLDRWEQGRDYLIALKHHEDLFWLLPEHLGIFAIDPDGAMVRGIIREEPQQRDDRSHTRGRAEPVRTGVQFGKGDFSGEDDGEGYSEQMRTPITLDEAWILVADLYDAIHRRKQPSEGVLDYWVAKLQSEDFIESWTGLEYFGTLRASAVAPRAVIDAVEKHLTNPPADYDPDLVSSYQHTAFLVDAIRVLILSADESAVDRILTLYEQTLSSSGEGFYEVRELKDDLTDKMLRLSLKFPGPKRRERFLTVFSAMAGSGGPGVDHDLEVMLPEMLAGIQEDDIDLLLWDMVKDPAAFDIRDLNVLRTIWTVAALRTLPQFGAYLDDVLTDPNSATVRLGEDSDVKVKDVVELAQHAIHAYIVAAEARGLISRTEAIQRLIEQYKQDNLSLRHRNTSIIGSIAELIEPADTQFIPFLASVLSGKDGYPGPAYLTSLVPIVLTAERMFDPSLVPAARAALSEKVTGKLLEILYFSGAEEESVAMALSILDKLVNDDPAWRSSVRKWYEFEDLAGLISFLGKTEDPTLAPVVEQFTGGELLKRLRKGHTDGATELQRAAVLALGRLGGASAIPRLRELYDSGDTYIRILAAWSLFYLGDDTGNEMIGHFLNHTERSQSNLEMHWDHWYGCDDLFRLPLMYLRSPQTDALLLESLHNLEHGFSPDRYLGNYGYGYAFLKQYKHQTLPIIVEHLDSTNRKARESANGLLKDLTGRDFGFCDDKFPGQQDNIITRWRAHVAEYLKRHE